VNEAGGVDIDMAGAPLLRLTAGAALLELLLHCSAEWFSRPASPHRAPQLGAEAFGAVADNATDDKDAIAKAMAACAAVRGCMLPVPGPGVYVSGPIALVSNLTLVITKGATLHIACTIEGWPALPRASTALVRSGT
jgi:hypothetical protein